VSVNVIPNFRPNLTPQRSQLLTIDFLGNAKKEDFQDPGLIN
jgi:hypothetical protein